MTGIVIHRSHHAQQYVVVPNAIARNARLSFRARGLLVMLLSLPPEWHVTAVMLAADNPESRTAIRAAMAELRDAGYVEMHKEQGERGRWTTRLEVFDTTTTGRAQAALGATSENSASPQVAPKAGKPDAGKPDAKKKYGTSSAPSPSARGRRKQPAAPAAVTDLCGRCGGRGHTKQDCSR